MISLSVPHHDEILPNMRYNFLSCSVFIVMDTPYISLCLRIKPTIEVCTTPDHLWTLHHPILVGIVTNISAMWLVQSSPVKLTQVVTYCRFG